VQPLARFVRTRSDHFIDGLKPQQRALKTLEQRVMEVAGDACPLVDARVERAVELSRELRDAEPVRDEQQRRCERNNDSVVLVVAR